MRNSSDQTIPVVHSTQRRSSNRASKTLALSALATSTGTNATRRVGYSYSNRGLQKASKSTAASRISPLPDDRRNQVVLSSNKKHQEASEAMVRTTRSAARNPPKKRWKANNQPFVTVAAASAAAEVTPHQTSVPSIEDAPTTQTTIVTSSSSSSSNSAHGGSNGARSNHQQASRKRTHSNETKTKTRRPKGRNTRTTKQHSLREAPRILARLNLDGGVSVETNDGGRSSIRSVTITTYSHAEAFPLKLYRMIHKATLEQPNVCRWSQDGKHIEVVDHRNPALESMLQKHFKHSRWLSFKRQLNNYGFASSTSMTQGTWNVQVKSYRHPLFYRDIPDPTALTTLLPYLPGLKRKQDKESHNPTASLASSISRTTKRSKRSGSSRAAANTSLSNYGPSPPKAVTPSTKAIGIGGIEGIPTIVSKNKAVTPSTKAIGTERIAGIPAIVSGNKAVTPLTKAIGTEGISTIASDNNAGNDKGVRPHSGSTLYRGGNGEPKARTTKNSTKLRPAAVVSSCKHNGNDGSAVVDFLKTPSPRYRGKKAPFPSSPPPLSHYLHKSKNQHGTNREHSTVTSGGKYDEPSGPSDIPSSLLAVNFAMTPSPTLERTPRTHNLSSQSSTSSLLSLVPSPSILGGGATNHTNRRSPDGVRMLSWAAQAVESPDFRENKQEGSQDTSTPDGTATSTNLDPNRNVAFTESIDCSPIVAAATTNDTSSMALGEAIHRRCPPTHNNESMFPPSFSSPPKMPPHPAMHHPNDGSTGPSPLSFRDHQDTEVELELLRNCLEDVFVANATNGRSTAHGGSIVPEQCGSAWL